jgi:serine/threonine protein kinase
MIGEILDAKYRIDKQLGAGGMGNVYLATHLGTTRVVAVKVIAPRWAAEPQFLARFQREAQACGRLRHPNIVNVTDFGIAKAAGGDMPYLVMEFLDGQTLSDFQKANPKIALPLIADLLDQIGLALAEAHRHGIVHRDLKPDNIWLEPNGRGGYTVKVLDFGVAKVNLLGEWGPRLQETPEAAPRRRSSPPAIPGGESETAGNDDPPRAERPRPSPSRRAVRPTPPDRSTAAPARTPCPAACSELPRICRRNRRWERKSISVPTSIVWPWWPTRWFAAHCPSPERPASYSNFTGRAVRLPPASIRKIPRDVSDAILAGLARNPADRPASAIAFTHRFHNAVDAEFLALRRSKAFLLQHLGAYALLMMPIYGSSCR